MVVFSIRSLYDLNMTLFI